jgi:hypothetical protein
MCFQKWSLDGKVPFLLAQVPNPLVSSVNSCSNPARAFALRAFAFFHAHSASNSQSSFRN